MLIMSKQESLKVSPKTPRDSDRVPEIFCEAIPNYWTIIAETTSCFAEQFEQILS